MAKYRLKREPEVSAHQHEGNFDLRVISEQKGAQTARKGDWLIGSEKGKVFVMSDAQFQRDYELIAEPVDFGDVAEPVDAPVDDAAPEE
jgi:hypothetical protein